MQTLPLQTPVVNPAQATTGVKTWAFYLSLFGTIVTCVGGWVTAKEAIQRNSVKIETQEKRVDRIDDKLDIIIEKINAVDVKLESKQDRPK